MAEPTDKTEETEEVPVQKVFEVEASSLDDNTHYELGLLYRESTETLRYAKTLQWKTLSSSLLIYLGTTVIASMAYDGRIYTKMQGLATMLGWACLLTPIAATFMLALFQLWQYNELQKIEAISKRYSNMFRYVRNVKSRREASLHRYIILMIMIIAVNLGAWLAYMANQLILLKI